MLFFTELNRNLRYTQEYPNSPLSRLRPSAQPNTPDIQTHGHLSMTPNISEKHKVRNTFRCEIFGPRRSLVIEPVGFYSGLRCNCNEVLICFISMEQGCKGERSRWVRQV